MKHSIHNDLIHFLSQCGHAIAELAEDDIQRQGATELLTALKKAKTKEFSTSHYPAIGLFSDIATTAYSFNFDTLAPQLKWRPSPRTDYDAEVIALSSLNEMLDLKGVLAGLMFMSPHQVYPEHNHAPQELYFVLSGNAQWFYGGEEGYRTQHSGDLLYNHPHDLHGIKTQQESLLAFYILWGNKVDDYSY